jgi:branched-chain amino acid transport system substrate-binding protein
MRVYASLPLDGPAARLARDLLRGAQLAAERAAGVELVVLDGPAVENARRALADPEALAYLGDFHSRDVLLTAPLLSAGGLLQVAPVATFTGLGGETLVRLSPNDLAGAAAVADWLVGMGARSLLVLHDWGEEYAVPVARMCVRAARSRGLPVASRPIDARVDGVGDAVLYVGVAGSGAVELWQALHSAAPEAWLLGLDGVAAPWLAAALDAAVAARTRFFVAQRASFAMYGYEAMSLILDCAGPDRVATVRAARATRDRESALGRYSVAPDGLTTTTAYARVAVVAGELVWDRD